MLDFFLIGDLIYETRSFSFSTLEISFASSSASATPKGDPGLRSGLRSLRSYIRYENLSKNYQKSVLIVVTVQSRHITFSWSAPTSMRRGASF